MKILNSTCAAVAHSFWEKLKGQGFNFFTGVPCSFLGDLIACIEAHEDYLPAIREDSAMGVAAGAWLGGKRPVVLMQNSGLGVSYNALTSLNLIYKIPALLIISLRGYQIPDAPEHQIMGSITPGLLETIKIPYRIPTPESLEKDLECLDRVFEEERKPVALLIRKGMFGG